jgi:hypothetical protein
MSEMVDAPDMSDPVYPILVQEVEDRTSAEGIRSNLEAIGCQVELVQFPQALAVYFDIDDMSALIAAKAANLTIVKALEDLIVRYGGKAAYASKFIATLNANSDKAIGDDTTMLAGYGIPWPKAVDFVTELLTSEATYVPTCASDADGVYLHVYNPATAALKDDQVVEVGFTVTYEAAADPLKVELGLRALLGAFGDSVVAGVGEIYQDLADATDGDTFALHRKLTVSEYSNGLLRLAKSGSQLNTLFQTLTPIMVANNQLSAGVFDGLFDGGTIFALDDSITLTASDVRTWLEAQV